MGTGGRGSGIALACGTGACAVCVAGVLTGRTGRRLLAHLPGGDLQLHWSEADNRVYMTGPATEVFTGEWPEENQSEAARMPLMKIRHPAPIKALGCVSAWLIRLWVGSL